MVPFIRKMYVFCTLNACVHFMYNRFILSEIQLNNDYHQIMNELEIINEMTRIRKEMLFLSNTLTALEYDLVVLRKALNANKPQLVEVY
mgnify:CR=1 FL=1